MYIMRLNDPGGWIVLALLLVTVQHANANANATTEASTAVATTGAVDKNVTDVDSDDDQENNNHTFPDHHFGPFQQRCYNYEDETWLQKDPDIDDHDPCFVWTREKNFDEKYQNPLVHDSDYWNIEVTLKVNATYMNEWYNPEVSVLIQGLLSPEVCRINLTQCNSKADNDQIINNQTHKRAARAAPTQASTTPAGTNQTANTTGDTSIDEPLKAESSNDSSKDNATTPVPHLAMSVASEVCRCVEIEEVTIGDANTTTYTMYVNRKAEFEQSYQELEFSVETKRQWSNFPVVYKAGFLPSVQRQCQSTCDSLFSDANWDCDAMNKFQRKQCEMEGCTCLSSLPDYEDEIEQQNPDQASGAECLSTSLHVLTVLMCCWVMC